MDQARLCVTAAIWREYQHKIPTIPAANSRSLDVQRELSRLLRVSQFVEPAPLGKQRSRDLKDDRYLAAAVAIRADALVTSDRDLLALGKPFGVPVLSPVEFIKTARSPDSP